MKKNLETELVFVGKQLELHTVLEDLTAREDLVKKERGDATNGQEPEALASLKLSVKDARRDANQDLESLGKFRTSAGDRFDRAAHLLTDLEQPAGQEPQEPTSKKDKRRRSKGHCSDDPEDRDSMSEPNGP